MLWTDLLKYASMVKNRTRINQLIFSITLIKLGKTGVQEICTLPSSPLVGSMSAFGIFFLFFLIYKVYI